MCRNPKFRLLSTMGRECVCVEERRKNEEEGVEGARRKKRRRDTGR